MSCPHMWTRGQVNDISSTWVQEDKINIGILGISQIKYIQAKINISNTTLNLYLGSLSQGVVNPNCYDEIDISL